MYFVPQPLSADTLVSAAVRVVFPWSTCPMVPTFTCGLVRSNFALAMFLLNPGPVFERSRGRAGPLISPGHQARKRRTGDPAASSRPARSRGVCCAPGEGLSGTSRGPYTDTIIPAEGKTRKLRVFRARVNPRERAARGRAEGRGRTARESGRVIP